MAGPSSGDRAESPALRLIEPERVEVRYVLLDVTAVDRAGRPVPGLTRDEFELLVDYRPVPIESLDVRCEPAEGVADAGPATTPEDDATDPPSPARVLLVFDYFHLADPVRALREFRSAMASTDLQQIEHAVVSLGESLRLESEFSTRNEVLTAALDRMIEDRSLYAGQHDRLTEHSFFERLESLLDLLAPIEGRKLVLLVSGPLRRDGWNHDPAHRRIAALAGETRTSLYPVDSGGLRPPGGFRYGDLGGPPGLVRLAAATGGRTTHHTNDLALAYRRARGDLACSYTLGFRDARPRLDEPRRIRVFARRGAGIRVRHGEAWIARSEQRRLEGRTRSAVLVPERFPSDGLRAAWRAADRGGARRPGIVLALEWNPDRLPPVDPAASLMLDGALVNDRGTRIRRIAQRLERFTTAIELGPYELRPGRYTASLVLSSPGWQDPRAVRIDIELVDTSGPDRP